MKLKIIMALSCLLYVGNANAQFVTFDPTNLGQSIINTTKNVVQTSTTASNMIGAYEESKKIYNQGKEFYDALVSVKDIISDSYKVVQTLDMVFEITEIYTRGYNEMLNNEHYTIEELSAIAYGYTRLMAESNEVVNELSSIVSVTSLSMSDKERMEMVDDAYNAVLKYRNLVNYFTNKNLAVGYLRGKKIEDAERMTALYGSSEERYW
ncbi:MAG: DUF4141 domain-containing protein [Rikenellaceae bacterium]